MGSVRSLDGPSRAELAVGELGNAIHIGVLRPHEEISVPDLADRHDIRLSVLRDALTGLSREGLLSVHGDTAVVAPLELGELAGISRLRREIELDMFARSCALIPSRELDRIEAVLDSYSEPDDPTAVANAGNGMSFWSKVMKELNMGLCAPVASPIEQRLLRSVVLASRRYHSLGWSAMRQSASSPISSATQMRQEHLARCHDLVDAFRTRSQVKVREVGGRHCDDSDAVVRESLIPDHTAFSPRLRQARRQASLPRPDLPVSRTHGGNRLRLVTPTDPRA